MAAYIFLPYPKQCPKWPECSPGCSWAYFWGLYNFVIKEAHGRYPMTKVSIYSNMTCIQPTMTLLTFLGIIESINKLYLILSHVHRHPPFNVVLSQIYSILIYVPF